MYFCFNNISIKYGKKKIIENVTIDFPKGKITTIIGKNGCGKSSMLRLVSKAVKQEKGNVIFEDRCIKTYKPKDLAKRIAMLPQIRQSPSNIDVRTLVSYGRFPHINKFRGMTLEDKQIIDDIIELTGLSKLQYQPIVTLSGGEQQRAWIAMTICQKPEILILDEPTTFLDIGYQLEVLELVKKLNDEMGITIIMVLHDVNLAAKYSHYLCAIKDRELYCYGNAKEILNKKTLRDVFGIEGDIYEDKKSSSPFFIPQTQLTN